MARKSQTVSVTTKHTEFPLIVGVRDWEASCWESAYYPEDLPPEWRLAFYANDFTGVLVPVVRWRTGREGVCAGWVEEIPPGFRFLLETDGSELEAGENCARTLGAAFAGWVTIGGPRQPGSLAAAPIDEALNGDAPVVLVSPTELEDQRRLGRLLVTLADRPAAVVALIATGGAGAEAVKQLRLLAELSGLA